MPICKKCHRFVRKRNYNRHVKDCVPTVEDVNRFATSNVAHEEGFKRKRRERGKKAKA